jgi:hypothetical protein
MNDHIARKNPFSTQSRVTQLIRLKDVRISQELGGIYAIGQISESQYDPCVAYFGSQERRDESKPPHLVFANLSGDDADAKRFLESFGPLTFARRQASTSEVSDDLDLAWKESVRDTKERYEDPWEHYRRHLLLQPITVTSGNNRKREPVRINLSEFWAEQEHFLFVAQLIEAIRSARSTEEVRSLLRRLVTKPPEVRFGAFSWTSEVHADFQIAFGVKSPPDTGAPFRETLKKALLVAINGANAREILSGAVRLIELMVNSKLASVHPVLASEPCESGRTRIELQRSWLCQDLIGALYMMLFLDVEHQRRVVRCEGCGLLFQDAKENVIYCSSRCETRKRVREWWRKHGKKYRRTKRRMESNGRPGKKVKGRSLRGE